MNKSQAGQLGGLSTFKKYGRKHMRAIGKEGANTTWSRYSKIAIRQTQYALVRKSDGVIIRILEG